MTQSTGRDRLHQTHDTGTASLSRRSFLTSGAAAGAVVATPAREKGASVIVVEMNFDIGGRCMMSFGGLYIGGGNRMHQAAGMKDTPDLVFDDWARTEMPIGRFSDRALVRTYADDNLDMFAWLEKHGIDPNQALPDGVELLRPAAAQQPVI